jgi:hypothetical protein
MRKTALACWPWPRNELLVLFLWRLELGLGLWYMSKLSAITITVACLV